MTVSYFDAANQMLSSGKLDEAVEMYRFAIERNPNFCWSHHNLGKALAKLGRLEEAVASYRRASELEPESFTFYHQLGETYYKLATNLNHKNYARWSGEQLDEVFLRATNDLTDEEFLQETYFAYVKHKIDIEGKKYWLEQLSEGYLTRELFLSGFRQSAEFRQPISIIISAYLLEAAFCLRKAIDLNRDSAWSYYNLGLVLAKLGHQDEAISAYQKATELQPEQSLFHSQLTEANAFKVIAVHGDILANENLEVEINKELTEGYEFAQRNDLEGASQHWQRAVTLDWGKIETLLIVGYMMGNCGKLVEAVDFCNQYYQKQRELARSHGIDNLGIRILHDNWTVAIGHTALLDCYVKMGILGWRPQQRTVVFPHPSLVIANSCYLNYWHRYVQILSEPAEYTSLIPMVRYLNDFFFALPAKGETLLYFQADAAVQKQWEAEGRAPLLTLSDFDFERGWRTVESLGVPKNAWFVCLHARESGYHNHVVELQEFRNADVGTYLLAVEEIVKRGGWVVRMGDSTMKPLPPMEGVIDYAQSSVKSDWMDVFLCAASRFFLGSTSGLAHVPGTFGVPCALANWACMGITSSYGKDIFIPKLYWSETLERYLTVEEAMSPPYGQVNNTKMLSALGVKLKENTPEEIRDLTLEMLAWLDGTIQYEASDEVLQERFKELATRSKACGNSRMGRDFLRKYAKMLSRATD
ncbi:TIGR04372 family glycosyltransferase [Microcoleus sp. T2B6]|uniref:TIGR04372 family glycosyltransferase n=1 Tax=Microcoleus sp. T2B6 TaxID=3055424 RepID=UPI002FD68C07